VCERKIEKCLRESIKNCSKKQEEDIGGERMFVVNKIMLKLA
jgi:hypothetical protein